MTTRFSTLIERARSGRPVTILTILGVLLLPAALGGVLVTALQNPTERLDEMTAAIVNLDEPVTIDGQLAPLGRQLAAGLVDGTGDEDSNLTWVISNEKDAAAGLADGTYQTVVTIPKDFSSAATSSGRALQDDGVAAEKAEISVSTAPESRVADGLIANQIASVAASTMGSTLSEKTMENVLLGFTTIGDQIGEAATGAGKLATGAKDAATGAAKLPDGATQIADGAGQLSTGAGQLADGLGTIAEGSRGAQSGADQLAVGLTGGADALLAQGIVPAELLGAADGAAAATSGVASGLDQLAPGLSALAGACAGEASAEFCAKLSAMSGLASGLPAPASGAAQAAAGTAAGVHGVASQAPATIAEQMRQAGAAAGQLAAGIGQLTGGIDQSAEGARGLQTGASGLQTGAAQLAEGATALSTGLTSLSSGTADLASGLDKAATSLPTYSDSRASSLASVVASPVKADATTDMFGPTAIPLLSAVVLWFGGLASFIVMRAVTARTLTSRRASASLALRAFAPAAAIGAGQGVLVALIVQMVAGYDAAHWWAFAGLSVLAGVVFAAVNQALVAVLGGTGRWIAAIAGVMAVAAGIISTLPGWLATVAGALPTSPAATALLGEGGTGAAVAGLVTWGVLSLVATTLAVARRRTTSAKTVLATA
ncbi:putative membrane protein [Microbacterium resistens]|uniref:Membrane protein n=1 Tax=Microbacterium resistens TaxID=156977 RepID=A0ABU1SEH3_9MICO|nr:YhgE/Pip family protein [Microbacterium resistens]MDR6867323.1 putative membrane protein [Microbacterium resistens]